MFSRCQIWRLWPLRHSVYKQRGRSHSFIYGNKERSILYVRESGWPNIGTKTFYFVETSNLRDYYFYSNPSKHLLVLKTFSKRLQRNNFSSFKTSWRRFESVLEDEKLLRSRHLQDVFKTCLQDVFKTCLQDVFKTFDGNVYWEYLYLKNLNLYLIDLYLTYLYLTNQGESKMH